MKQERRQNGFQVTLQVARHPDRPFPQSLAPRAAQLARRSVRLAPHIEKEQRSYQPPELHLAGPRLYPNKAAGWREGPRAQPVVPEAARAWGPVKALRGRRPGSGRATPATDQRTAPF